MTIYNKPSKVTPAQLDLIRSMRAAGYSCADIADETKFTERAVRSICSTHEIPSTVRRAGRVVQEDKHDIVKVRAAADLHVQDILRAHGPDKRWQSYPRMELPIHHVPIYLSTTMSVVGSPAMTCTEAAGVD